MKHKLEFQAAQRDEVTWTYTVTGSLYGSTGGYELQDAIREHIASGARKIVVDLAAVDRIDSTGVGILVTIMWSASHAGGRLIVTALPQRVENVLSLAMLLDHIDRAETVQEALAKLDASG